MMQSLDLCVLCKGRTENTAAIEGYYPGTTAHVQCIENKTCTFCGVSSLCVKCQHKDCMRTFHLHCFQRYFSDCNNSHMLLCDLHRRLKGKKKEYQRLWFARQVSNKVGNNIEVLKMIKDSQGDNKHYSICSGQVFWYMIGTQFFPNFVSLFKPEIEVRTLVEYEEPWNCDIDDYIKLLSAQYDSVNASNSVILLPHSHTQCDSSKDLREEEVILSETRNLSLREGFEEYLKYFETKGKEETEGTASTEKRTSSLREVPKNEEDFVCSICGDGDYEDDDLIVICSTCEIGAHMKCYGIPVVPEADWHCHGCTYTTSKEERFNLRCALCPIRGGCIKPTIHYTTGNLTFPNYPEGLNELVWCHIFCAVHLDMSVFSNKENLTGINLKNIDAKRFALRCQVCKSKDGACLQCQHGRCQAAFHPECGKDFFTNTRDKTGYDEVSIYCPMHKPLKLRRVLEGRGKKCVEDVISFCKYFERFERKARLPALPPSVKRPLAADRPFTYKEKDKIIKAADKEIKKIGKLTNQEFSWVIRLKSASLRNNIEVNRPKQYNLLDPLAFLHSKISISGRKFAECHKFYSNSLYKLMKQELILLGEEVCTYIPPVKKKGEKDLQKPKNRSKEKRKNKDKRDKKKLPTQYLQTFIDIPILNDVVTADVYCICKKPFVEQSLKKPWESETDFMIRQAETQMIQCEKCEEWFHYKCIGLKYDSQIPETYFCGNCKPVEE